MSIALSEFWTRLVRSGVTDAGGCKLLAASYSAAHGGTPPSDAVTLAKFMIETGELTNFQAGSLLSDQPQPIRIGSYLVRSPKASSPLSQWAEVSRIDNREAGVLFQATPQQLSGGRAQWLEAHVALTKRSLQGFEVQAEANATLVFSCLPTGRCLHDILGDRGSLSPKETCQIGIAVAEALETLHARPLIHGSVRPDRVWVTEAGEAILLRDPSGPPEAPLAASGTQGSWLDQLDAPAAYAAPEFANPQQVCTQSTDLYALGCLLFRLASGRVPVEGNTVQETVAAHLSETPEELAVAVQQGESGDPLYRVIAFAMAKNPAARFATAAQLLGALHATLPLLPEVPAANPVPAKPQVNKSSQTPPRLKTPQSKEVVGDEPTARTSSPSRRESTHAGKPKSKVQTRRPEPPRTPAANKATGETSLDSAPPRESSPAKSTPKGRSQIEPNEERTSAATPPIDTAAETLPVSEMSATVAEATDSSSSLMPPAGIPSAGGTESSPPRPVRRRRKKKNNAPLILGGLCVLVLMLIIGLIVHDPSPVEAKRKDRPKIPAVIPPVSSKPAPTPVDDSPATAAPLGVEGYELVEDERLLFVPPYTAESPAAPLELLPPGPAVIVSVRFASIVESSLGADLIDSLSPELTGLVEAIAARSGVPIESIKRCSAAMHPGQDGWPEVSLAVDLKEPLPSSQLIEKWQVAPSRTPAGATVYAGDSVNSDAYYFDANSSESISRFAVGSIGQISEVAAAEGGAALLPRTLQSLWNGSSDQADLVVLVTPNFLFADGRSLLQSSAPELVRPLKSVLIPDVAGALVTAHVVDQQLYVETRLAPSGGITEPALLRRMRDSIQAWPTWADQFIVESVPDPSWRLLASRLPSMMRFVVDQTRFGISDRAVVANMYLPKQAVPQITLATLLAMNTRSGGAGEIIVTTAPTLSVEEMLARNMSVSFEQESLEFAIDAIVGDYQRTLPAGSTLPPVKIMGGDLQLMGITQNQQVRAFNKTDVPLRTVLTDLLVGANPDKSATGPKDPKQALIWVLADDPDDPGRKAILVTTRQAAENKYELPEEFRLEQ